MSDVERPWDKAENGETSPAGNPVDKKSSGCLWPFLGLTALVVSVGFAFASCGGDSGSSEPSAYEARMQCERWVTDKLKAPSTAKFSGASEVSAGVNAWSITGEVDSENGFGAMVRSTWSCEIRLDGDTWRGSTAVG